MEERDKQATDAHRSRPQFSLRALFGLTTGVAVVCSVFAMPDSGLLTLLLSSMLLAFPLVLIIMVIHERGYLRAFAIGALFPATFALVCLAVAWDQMPYAPGWRAWFLQLEKATDAIRDGVAHDLVFGFVAGLLAVATRWAIEKRQRGHRESQKESHDDG
ncbi:MAG: hypothetical protein HQ567_00175 [Candidatus Nealsonbacteria bacterium]|nr:hypothetical protein [Candidatus Nealsonbacteria bacterium]